MDYQVAGVKSPGARIKPPIKNALLRQESRANLPLRIVFVVRIAGLIEARSIGRAPWAVNGVTNEDKRRMGGYSTRAIVPGGGEP